MGEKSRGGGTEIFFSKSLSQAYELGFVSNKLKGYIGGSSDDFITGNTNITDTSWHHVAFTYIQSSGQAYLYLDGVVDKEEVLTAIMGTTTIHLDIGERYDGTSPFDGAMDKVLIYARSKSAAQIAADCYELTCAFHDEGALLLEIGDNLLLETGGDLLLN